jgi:predicted PurR-regulated permease PerM
MLAALVGGAAGGIPGALFATPLVGAVKQLYLEFRYGRTTLDERSGRERIRQMVPRRGRRSASPPA